MVQCVFDENILGKDTKPEHVLHNAFGGRKITRRIICSECNNRFGGGIDKVLAGQFEIIRNLLQMKSGSGDSAPMLRKIKAGSKTVDIHGDGRIELRAKPFTIKKHEDGRFDLQIMTRSLGEIRRHIPNIAAALGMSEEQVREQLGNAQAMMLEQRPSTEPFQMTFGGPEAFRSAAKSCLVLWALKVGNEEVRSEPYAAIRNYILNDDPSFIRTRTNLDTRVSEAAESIKQAYGPIFNFIYIRSDGAGRVVGHFTIFNLIASQVVLAESGGTPSQTIGLVSNPLNPRDWSDSAASMFDVPFDWLNCPSYDLDQARARFVALHESYRKIYGPQPIAKMSDAVFTKYGLGPNDRIPEDIFEQAVNELIQRIGYYMAGVPYQSVVTPDELRNAINELGSNKETD